MKEKELPSPLQPCDKERGPGPFSKPHNSASLHNPGKNNHPQTHKKHSPPTNRLHALKEHPSVLTMMLKCEEVKQRCPSELGYASMPAGHGMLDWEKTLPRLTVPLGTRNGANATAGFGRWRLPLLMGSW